MAAEALRKVREAEEKGSETLKNAGEQAKDIVRKAEADGERKRKEIIAEAHASRDKVISAAKSKANDECEALIKASEKETGAIRNPAKDKAERAMKLIIERIVSAGGHS